MMRNDHGRKSMSQARRILLGIILLSFGVAAEAALERMSETPRPLLKGKLETIPTRLGPWLGQDEKVDPGVLAEAQATDYLSRVYHDTRHPERRVGVWINYSIHGLNLRHSPEICLPSGGWTKVESQSRVIEIARTSGEPMPITRLTYSKGELVHGIGFWYYIFGEGKLEHLVRSLPITSRSSHGRTTRGSGLTVEIFCPGESDPDGTALQDFAQAFVAALEPILPENQAQYFIP
jgi:EpsI family protein